MLQKVGKQPRLEKPKVRENGRKCRESCPCRYSDKSSKESLAGTENFNIALSTVSVNIKLLRTLDKTSFYKQNELQAEIPLDVKLSYSSHVYEFMKSTSPLPARFQEFQDSCLADGEDTQRLFLGVKKMLLGLFEHTEPSNFEKIIFHDFHRKLSLAEGLSGMDTETANSHFGLMLRDLKCDLQELDPAQVDEIKNKIAYTLGMPLFL